MTDFINLVTTYNFRGKEHLVNLNSIKQRPGNIEIKVTDKSTLEEWLGLFDASYIENLTRKTGNYKQFDTFLAMLKSGVLCTSQCVTLDLLTFEDLEMLKSRVPNSRNLSANHAYNVNSSSSNRRFLIVTYTVEFDRIHYPLLLEYCGLPDPRILQQTIQRLEKQVTDLQQQLGNSNWDDIKNQINALQKKVVDVTTENILLKEEIKKLSNTQQNKSYRKERDLLLNTIFNLENEMKTDRKYMEKLQKENSQLSFYLEEALKSEKFLKSQLNALHFENSVTNKGKGHSNNKFNSLSPTRNGSLDNFTHKPIRKPRPGGRKIRSARSSFENVSLSDGSITSGSDKGRSKKGFHLKFPTKPRASSPSLSDLSHNSEVSRCACRNCLNLKFIRGDQYSNAGKQKKGRGKMKIIERIQSLEKLLGSAA